MENTNDSRKAIIKIIVSALTVVLVLLIAALVINLVRLNAVNERKRALIAQQAKLERLIEESEKLGVYYGSNEFVEEYAREVLDMIYRGETVIGGK